MLRGYHKAKNHNTTNAVAHNPLTTVSSIPRCDPSPLDQLHENQKHLDPLNLYTLRPDPLALLTSRTSRSFPVSVTLCHRPTQLLILLPKASPLMVPLFTLALVILGT